MKFSSARVGKSFLLTICLTMATLCAADAAASEWCVNPRAAELPWIQHQVDQGLASSPRAVAQIHVEGTLPHQGIWDASMEAKKDWPQMRNLAVLWKASHNQAQLQQLSRLLVAWATTYQIDYNPIDEADLDGLLDAYIIVRSDLSQDVRDSVSRWIGTLGAGYLVRMEQMPDAKSGIWANNWNSHRVKLASLSAVALADRDMLRRARAQFQAQLSRNVRADGSTLDFEERDAIDYVTYDLEPLLHAALAAQLAGENWYAIKGSAGAGLPEALTWLQPYALGQKSHEEFVHSSVKFDAQRRAAGLPGFSGLWDRKKAYIVYRYAALLDKQFQPVSDSLPVVKGWLAACW
ncbi:MAG TPA: alginate lyase family protein [Steroidobacteraceae bacterium]|jgi:hypothetical protein|nr:alginate lyase family protein [Steroidobacteraceae bacterium]